jgi:hypothetical protein
VTSSLLHQTSCVWDGDQGWGDGWLGDYIDGNGRCVTKSNRFDHIYPHQFGNLPNTQVGSGILDWFGECAGDNRYD